MLGFLLSLISLWITSKNLVDTAKMGIGLGCFCGIILACFALVYLSRVKDLEHNYVIKN